MRFSAVPEYGCAALLVSLPLDELIPHAGSVNPMWIAIEKSD